MVMHSKPQQQSAIKLDCVRDSAKHMLPPLELQELKNFSSKIKQKQTLLLQVFGWRPEEADRGASN